MIPNPLVRNMSALPPLFVRTHHKFRKTLCSLHQKVRTSAFEEPLLPDCGRVYGQPLINFQ